MKKTKIVATIGPASDSEKMLRKMMQAGMNVVRINFSHGDYKSNGQLISIIKKLRKEMEVPIGIMADLQGPRIRVGNEEKFSIEKGEIISVIDKQGHAGKELIIDSPGIISSLEKGERILVEDGLLELKVTEKNGETVRAEVINGGEIKPRKGINMPDTDLSLGALTEKDEKDLEFALKEDVDFVALSFVSNGKEVLQVREKIKNILGRENDLPQIVSKIERKEAIKNIDDIIIASNAIMVARGDLGIELEESKVVIFQKEIIAKCLRAGVPVIVATQMLDSMINNPKPTRAEVSDVSNAVIDHADAVMLSGESASGKYPIESIETMAEIIKKTEESPFDNLQHGFLDDSEKSVSASVANSAHDLARDSRSKFIVAASVSGFTARMIARHRPEQVVYTATNSQKTYNQMSIIWGVDSFILPDCKTLDELISKSVGILREKKLVSIGERLVIVAGRPHKQEDHMSLVKIEEIR